MAAADTVLIVTKRASSISYGTYSSVKFYYKLKIFMNFGLIYF